MAFYMDGTGRQSSSDLFGELLRRQSTPANTQASPNSTMPPVTGRFGYQGGDLLGKLSGFSGATGSQ